MKAMCATCGVVFKSKVIDFRRRDGDGFYCPNGHVSSYKAAIANDKIREAKAIEDARLAAIAEKEAKEKAEADEKDRLKREAEQRETDRIAALTPWQAIKEAVIKDMD